MFIKHGALAAFLLAVITVFSVGNSVAQGTKTLTIKGSNADSGDTIEIPSSAEVSVVAGSIVLTQLDLRLRCLGEATANGYCYIAANGGGDLVDSDGDSVPDSWDICPDTPSSTTVINTSGCADVTVTVITRTKTIARRRAVVLIALAVRLIQGARPIPDRKRRQQWLYFSIWFDIGRSGSTKLHTFRVYWVPDGVGGTCPEDPSVYLHRGCGLRLHCHSELFAR